MKKIDKLLFYWIVISELLPNILLSITENVTLLGRITNVLLPLGALGIICAISKHIGRTVWFMLPYTLLAAFQIVLLWLYGDGVLSVDMFLNVLTTNSVEVSELLGRLWICIVLVIIIYGIPLFLGGYCIFKKYRLSQNFINNNRKAFGLTSIVGILCLCGCYYSQPAYEAREELYPVNMGYNLYLTYIRCQQLNNYSETSANFIYNSEATHDAATDEKYILIIGETSRVHNWQLLGYPRPTNPKLSKRNDLIVADKAYSESNTTHKSVPMLLSNVNARTYDKEINKVKSVLTAFKEAGFHTSFISNQMPNHSYIDYFGFEADSTLFVKLVEKDSGDGGDFHLLPYIKNSLESGHKKQLIVVHTYGSHFNYRDRYTEEDRLFVPDNFTEASGHCRAELINAYDNTIVATDRFLNSVIEILEGYPGINGMLYTSDHGEDIFDDGGNRFLHASPAPTDYQLHVPFLIWLSPDYLATYPETVDILKRNSNQYLSPSRSFCPTAMSIGGVKSEKIDSTGDLTSPAYKAGSLMYLNDHNQPVPLTKFVKSSITTP